jgi:integrase
MAAKPKNRNGEPPRAKVPQASGKPRLIVQDANGQPVFHGAYYLGWNRASGYFYVGGPVRHNLKTRDRDDAVYRFRRWLSNRGIIQENLTVDEIAATSGIHHGPTADGFVHWRDYFRALLLTDPKKAAEELDIPDIRHWQTATKEPATLEEVGQLYLTRKSGEITPKELAKAETWWADFCRIVRVETVRDLDFERFDHYANRIKSEQAEEVIINRGGKKKARPRSKSYTRNRFYMIRTILNHAADCRLISADEIGRLKGEWKVPLKAPKKPRRQKYMIQPTDFQAMLKAAADPQDRAMLLLMMNAALYPKDIADLRWSDLDLEAGTLQSFREKRDSDEYEGIVRCAVLWSNTVAALKELAEFSNGEFVFTRQSDRAIHPDTCYDHVMNLKRKAKITRHFEARSLRDSAATIAARKAPPHQYTVLLGHKVKGADDEYLIRNPEFVADACRAIEAHYFPEPV